MLAGCELGIRNYTNRKQMTDIKSGRSLKTRTHHGFLKIHPDKSPTKGHVRGNPDAEQGMLDGSCWLAVFDEFRDAVRKYDIKVIVSYGWG